MAFGLTDTSRLGCQVQLTRELDGMTVTLPSATRNMFVDGKSVQRLFPSFANLRRRHLSSSASTGNLSLSSDLILIVYLPGKKPTHH